MIRKKLSLGVVAASIGLAACTNPDGTPNRTATGATVGALGGAALGNIIGEDSRSTLIGAAAGAAAGGVIGNRLDAQARELQQTLGGTGAGVVNTGQQLVVSLPESITFPVDSVVVRPDMAQNLRAVAQNLQNYPNTSVQVVGHTDNTGSAAYNQSLSERRAAAVANILMGSGVPASRVSAYGRGFSQPIAGNDTAAGRAANRRVEIVITPMA